MSYINIKLLLEYRRYGICRGIRDGKFFAVGNSGTVIKSSDGITWTEVSESASDNSSGLLGNINDITYGNGTYVLVGSLIGDVYSSSDGNSWTSRTSGTSNTLYGVTYKE